MLMAWRLVKRDFAGAAFDGEGARLYGGRWNSTGMRVVYTAGSQALALLEVLVHLANREQLLHYQMGSIEFDAKQVTRVSINDLPTTWRAAVAPLELQEVGNRWVSSQTSVVLSVPSVLVSDEVNYLVNPAHADFKRVKLTAPRPYPFDERLLR